VWGVVFVGVGLLVLISLVSHLAGPEDNILGPFLGRRLSSGLVLLFGPIASFVIPLGALYAGARLFRGAMVAGRTLLFWTILTIELCVLLAVYDMPAMARADRIFKPNFAGHLVVYLLHYLFGVHRFGPYFIFVLAFIVTAAIGFQINLRLLCRRVWAALTVAWRWLSVQSREAVARIWAPAPEPRPAEAGGGLPASAGPIAEPAAEPRAGRGKKAKKEGGEEERTEAEENEAKRRFEEELAAFRKKRGEPIRIMTEEADSAAGSEGTHEDGADGAGEAVVDEEAGDGEGFEEEYEDSEDYEGIAGDVSDEGIDPREVLERNADFGEEAIPGKVPEEERPCKPKKQTKPYVVPAPDTIADPPVSARVVNRDEIESNSRILEKTLLNFGVEGKVVNVGPGPVVTRYEVELAPGVKISRVVSLTDDLSLAVGGKRIRIEAPIPGKAAVGIELPNEEMQIVHFKDVLTSEVFRSPKNKVPVVIGKAISGSCYVADITRMPHLLIAGQTGSGKSVCINSLICSMLMTKTPEELRLILIDPKKVEMSYYQGIPHLLAPVVTESKEAVKALQWGVGEMARRYRLLARVHARNIDSFNKKMAEKSIPEGVLPDSDNKPLPFIVIFVDELADLMLTASRDVEALIQRIAQLARAVGIHLIVATQRPSVDIITGPIKANLTSRIAFRTIQSTDSRTILGHVGAEKLLGRGDMLFLRNGAPDIERCHGAFISEADVETIVEAIRSQSVDTEVLESFDEAAGGGSSGGGGADGGEEQDELFEEAARLVVSTGQGSTSFIQRRLKVGYARAGRIMDELYRAGVVGPQEGSKVREILVKPEGLEALLAKRRGNG
jgi:DNA segregation ATPase FtsK/SpoIIIE-like protein